MTQNITAEIITIGTELLLGELTDTNSVFIAQMLRNYGINLYYITSVGDNEQRIAGTIEAALARADVVITCGGLGPTIDDMTRQAVAIATQRELVFHPHLLEQIEERFRRYRVKMTDNNRRQAYLPADAIVIENPTGTAPSFIVEHHQKLVISLPGVPREMKFLMTESVLPFLKNRFELAVILVRTLRTAGIGESTLDTLLGEDILNQANPSIGLAAHSGIIDVRLTAKADTPEQATALLDGLEHIIQQRVGRYIFGYDKASLEATFVDLINAQNGRLAILEAGLPKAVADSLARVNQRVFHQQLAHPYEVVQALGLDVPTDIPLSDLAVHCIEYIRAHHAVDVAIVILCLPDVDENPDIQAATVVAVQVGDEQRLRAYGFGGQSEFAQTWVGRWAIANVWQLLKESSHVG